MNYFVEIRSLNIKPGKREEFHRLYTEKSYPLLKRWNFDVVAFGPSPHDENTYYVIRRFDSLAQREQMEDAFYNGDDWKLGPREAILSLLENRFAQIFSLSWMRLLWTGCEKKDEGRRMKRGGIILEDETAKRRPHLRKCLKSHNFANLRTIKRIIAA